MKRTIIPTNVQPTTFITADNQWRHNLIFFTGCVCEQYNNPPDFFLDVINGDYTAVPQYEGTVLFRKFRSSAVVGGRSVCHQRAVTGILVIRCFLICLGSCVSFRLTERNTFSSFYKHCIFIYETPNTLCSRPSTLRHVNHPSQYPDIFSFPWPPPVCILAHRTQKPTWQNTQLFTLHLSLCSKTWLCLWRTFYLLSPNYISLQSMLLSHSSTSLYPALPQLVNCLYHFYLYRSLQTWLL